MICLLGFVPLLTAGCGAKKPPSPGPPAPSAPAPLVDVTAVRTERLVERVDAVGTLEANERVSIKPEIAGRIVRIGHDEGQPVSKGDVLVELDPGKMNQDLAVAESKLAQARKTVLQQREQLASSRAKIDAARAAVDRARRDVEELLARLARADAVVERARQEEARTRSLFEKEFKTRDDLEKSISAVKQAEADRAAVLAALGGVDTPSKETVHHPLVAQSLAALEAAKADEQAFLAALGSAADRSAPVEGHVEVQRALAEVEQAREKLKDLKLIAPMNGVLSVRHAAVGDYVDKGTLVFELIDLMSVKTAFKVPERYISRIRTGRSAEVRVAPYPNEVFSGVVYYIDPMADPESRTVLMKLRISNSDRRLKPGLFANVSISVGEFPEAVVIPEEAVVPQGGEFFAFVVEDGKSVQRPIRIGLRQPGLVQVLEGLRSGESVVVSGLQKIRDGSAVRTQP